MHQILKYVGFNSILDTRLIKIVDMNKIVEYIRIHETNILLLEICYKVS